MTPSEDRVRVVAVVTALKAAGVRVKNWKEFVSEDPEAQKGCCAFAFGRDLVSVPQCEVPEIGGTVPQFLVEVCDFLSLHLHTEGLFRKSGSLTRIRHLRCCLERGDRVFLPPLSSSLQPCDAASLLKQFLRELPCPLIPRGLQGALCRAQTLGEACREGATLLLTALLQPPHARALRYLCAFLDRAAQRSSESRMTVSSLALVMCPNLLCCPGQGARLDTDTAVLLDRQARALTTLITHADCIGVVPPDIMETLSLTPGVESDSANGSGLGAEPSGARYRRRHRRRSVGEMFADAFNKLLTTRTPTSAPLPAYRRLGQQGASPAPRSPFTSKRKATEDTAPPTEGSAKKRCLYSDSQKSPTPSLTSPPAHPLLPHSVSKNRRNKTMAERRGQR
ncbi:rho GTPase-activating protein 11A [Amia ocellicauda]|uniref:rho GTPase-activating protein 11A n=1 Tax=Amia ocellicauda TaxID=2972642 RepID=UPI00346430A1